MNSDLLQACRFPSTSKALGTDGNNDEKEIPCIDDRETTSLDIPDFSEKQIKLPSLVDLEKHTQKKMGEMHTKPYTDGPMRQIDLSVLTKHVIPPQNFVKQEDEVWNFLKVVSTLSASNEREK